MILHSEVIDVDPVNMAVQCDKSSNSCYANLKGGVFTMRSVREVEDICAEGRMILLLPAKERTKSVDF